jgi:hypothetical protein
MADDEHVALLKQDVDAWNKWRDQNPNIRPDLSKANLWEADLSGAILSGADLSKANLNEADLSGAYLGKAVLSGVDLCMANLRGARLGGAHLGGARGEPRRRAPRWGHSTEHGPHERRPHRLSGLRHICLGAEAQRTHEAEGFGDHA